MAVESVCVVFALFKRLLCDAGRPPASVAILENARIETRFCSLDLRINSIKIPIFQEGIYEHQGGAISHDFVDDLKFRVVSQNNSANLGIKRRHCHDDLSIAIISNTDYLVTLHWTIAICVASY